MAPCAAAAAAAVLLVATFVAPALPQRHHKPGSISGTAETIMESGVKQQQQQHFVLVHGGGHGAWCWYKLATLLTFAGHRVTALDLAASGASPGRIEEVSSFEEYSRPLLSALAGLPPEEKVVLVGHSSGGLTLALAMECYPDKVAVAVFTSAFMPAAEKPMATVLDMLSQERGPAYDYMDTKSETIVTGDPQHRHPVNTILLGPQYLKHKLYQLSPPEDLTLAVAMVRPSQLFGNDTKINGNVLTADRYGAVKRVCIIAEDDETLPPGFQRRMASLNPAVEVRVLQGADHMLMLSKPKELSELLMEMANKYS